VGLRVLREFEAGNAPVRLCTWPRVLCTWLPPSVWCVLFLVPGRRIMGYDTSLACLFLHF
jgi:hypothetical protein